MLSKSINRARVQFVRFASTDNTGVPDIYCYSSGTSMRSQIVRLQLAELGLKFENVKIDTEDKMNNHEDWYAKLNPYMTVPTLKYNDVVMTESRKISKFLNEQHP